MASKIYKRGLKGANYGTIQRGASFILPVEVKDEMDKPIDLSGLCVEFTVKKVKTDFDRHDDKAYIAKTFLPQDPVNGKFYVMLSSDDTDFEPGKFFFDVELHSADGMVFRLFTFEFELDGGPTNRRVNKGMGQWPTGDTITVIALAQGDPIIVVAPTINLDGDVFGQLATLMEAVERCEEHVAECELKDEEVKATIEQFREELDGANGQLADHEEDLEEVFEHLTTHDEALREILNTLNDFKTILKEQGAELYELARTVKQHSEDIGLLKTQQEAMLEEMRFHWKG